MTRDFVKGWAFIPMVHTTAHFFRRTIKNTAMARARCGSTSVLLVNLYAQAGDIPRCGRCARLTEV